MAVLSDNIREACAQISHDVRGYQKNMTLHFIVYNHGQHTEALGLAAQEILSHPAAETAMHILQRQRKLEDSALLGTAIAKQNIFFGLASRDSTLAMCAININQFESLRDVRRQAYHLVWHALDAAFYHNDPRNRSGDSSEVMIRRRNTLEQSFANLRADIFSAAMCSFMRDTDAIQGIAAFRGLATLHTRSFHAPEYFPYAIAMEAAEFAINEANIKAIAKKRFIPTALRIAHEVSMAFDENDIKNWLSFAESAQDMAWRGYSEAEIISAAVNTSPNTHIRNIGYQISELNAIKPTSIFESRENYSPYADNEFNEKLHAKIMEDIFHDVIAQGLRQNSAQPFLAMANQQNNALSDGRMLGWCAAALQAAGMAYRNAADKGEKPEPLATHAFSENKNAVSWDDLHTLGDKVIGAQRRGSAVGLDTLRQMAGEIEGLRAVTDSVTRTLSDPHYRQKLDAASELYASPAPTAPTPKIPEPMPLLQPAAPVMMPSFGPGGSAGKLAQPTVSSAIDKALPKKKKDKAGDSQT